MAMNGNMVMTGGMGMGAIAPNMDALYIGDLQWVRSRRCVFEYRPDNATSPLIVDQR